MRVRIGMNTPSLFNKFMATPIVVMLVPVSGQAIDLKAAKAPIQYECQTTLSGGLWQDKKTGEWVSGKVIPRPEKYRMVLERFDDTKDKRKADCTSEERRTGGNKQKGEEFCMTFVYTSGSQRIEDTRYCMVTGMSSVKGEFSALNCPLGRVFFDSDRLYGIKTDSPEFVELGMMRGQSVGSSKFNCLRLDR